MYRDVVPATVETRVAVKRVANMLQGGVDFVQVVYYRLQTFLEEDQIKIRWQDLKPFEMTP